MVGVEIGRFQITPEIVFGIVVVAKSEVPLRQRRPGRELLKPAGANAPAFFQRATRRRTTSAIAHMAEQLQ